MKTKKRMLLLLVSCLILSLTFCLAVAAEGEEAAKPGLSTGALVSLIIGGVVLLVLIVLCIVKREKVAAGFGAYRSEMKKITWYSWKNVWRGTVFVVVFVLVTALVIGLLDMAFFEGQSLISGNSVRLFG